MAQVLHQNAQSCSILYRSIAWDQIRSESTVWVYGYTLAKLDDGTSITLYTRLSSDLYKLDAASVWKRVGDFIHEFDMLSGMVDVAQESNPSGLKKRILSAGEGVTSKVKSYVGVWKAWRGSSGDLSEKERIEGRGNEEAKTLASSKERTETGTRSSSKENTETKNAKLEVPQEKLLETTKFDITQSQEFKDSTEIQEATGSRKESQEHETRGRSTSPGQRINKPKGPRTPSPAKTLNTQLSLTEKLRDVMEKAKDSL